MIVTLEEIVRSYEILNERLDALNRRMERDLQESARILSVAKGRIQDAASEIEDTVG